MSRTNKKKGSKWKQFKGDPGLYVVHTYKRDGVKKTVKHIASRRARRASVKVLKEVSRAEEI